MNYSYKAHRTSAAADPIFVLGLKGLTKHSSCSTSEEDEVSMLCSCAQDCGVLRHSIPLTAKLCAIKGVSEENTAGHLLTETLRGVSDDVHVLLSPVE